MESRLLQQNEDWLPLKDSGRIRVYRVNPESGAPWVIKLYYFRHWFDRLSFARKESRVKSFYQQMATTHLSLPELMGSGRLPSGEGGFFCYEFLPGNDFRHLRWAQLPLASATRLATQAGSLLAALHRHGWVHGDFKFGNLFYHEAADAVFLLDVEGVSRAAGSARKGRDLARFLLNGLELSVSPALLEQFWRAYRQGEADTGGRVRVDTRRWLEKLAERHQRQYRRKVDLGQLAFIWPEAL